ncbi:MAG: hypothetical protein AB1611_13675 [bacterium]
MTRRGQVLLAVLIIVSLSFASSGYSQQIRLGADYLFEKVQEPDNKDEYNFIQTYDLILEKPLRPLYDLKFKLQLRSESADRDTAEAENKNRGWESKYLPSFSLHLGNDVMGLDSGFSKDSIHEQDMDYDLTRKHATFVWSPFRLPRFTVQYQKEDRDLSDEEGSGMQKGVTLREDYELVLGIFTLSHSYAVERERVIEEGDDAGSLHKEDDSGPDYHNYDLHNRGQIGYQFSAFDSRLQLNSNYELSHHDKKDEEANNSYRLLEQKANFRFTGLPGKNTALHYNLVLGETRKWSEQDRERTLGNNLRIDVLPHEHLRSMLEVSHDNRWEAKEDERNSELTYGLRIEPEIPGLLLDPNVPMPPLKTSLLLSSSLTKDNGRLEYRTNSALLKGSTEVYRGVEIRTDFEVINTKDFQDQDKKWEENIKIDTSFALREDLKYYLRNENRWIRQDQGEELSSVRTFEGEVWHMITYRPADQLFLTLDNNIEYGDIDERLYGLRIGWLPVPKVRLEARYQTAETEEDEYFSSEMNINMTKTLKFRIKYTYPSDDQVISFRFTLKT